MMFIVIQNPASGETLTEMEAAIRETLDEFAGREVSEDDLQKFKTSDPRALEGHRCTENFDLVDSSMIARE